ncbi:hypothetical protein AJ79_02824 [Helicocarpus griseus UAMH5409]|uniref:Cyclin n=1 Tax=Helicocarpus griseus UAMH5409 TaxID=1447875 RepID=A0A2B7Y1X4_9EURO|nr:hypothetical protein AJ79_02824 [Helicocarpus griseus UAMH5409]
MNNRNQESEGSGVVVDLTTPIRRLSLSPKPRPQNAAPSSGSADDAKPISLSQYEEVFSISPESALKMLCAHVDRLARLTGDVPSSTPVGENIVAPLTTDESRLDGPRLHANDNAASRNKEPEDTVSPILLMKSFYSKRVSPIGLEDYLLRLHQYCPLSTAVYLAASHYITRMAIMEKIIYVTPRNMHRLVLGGLRVAAKMMEDLCYRHRRFAKVGGVTERELARLEINFCFLMDFELKVDVEMMSREIEGYRRELIGST